MSEELKMLFVVGSLIAFVVVIVVLARSGSKTAPPSGAEKPEVPTSSREGTKKHG